MVCFSCFFPLTFSYKQIKQLQLSDEIVELTQPSTLLKSFYYFIYANGITPLIAKFSTQGIKHLEKPIWGVQFHPESVCTQYGIKLLENFRDITLRYHFEHVLPMNYAHPQIFNDSRKLHDLVDDFSSEEFCGLLVKKINFDGRVFPDSEILFSALYGEQALKVRMFILMST